MNLQFAHKRHPHLAACCPSHERGCNFGRCQGVSGSCMSILRNEGLLGSACLPIPESFVTPFLQYILAHAYGASLPEFNLPCIIHMQHYTLPGMHRCDAATPLCQSGSVASARHALHPLGTWCIQACECAQSTSECAIPPLQVVHPSSAPSTSACTPPLPSTDHASVCDLLPLAVEGLLPQRHRAAAVRHRQHAARQRPAHPPYRRLRPPQAQRQSCCLVSLGGSAPGRCCSGPCSVTMPIKCLRPLSAQHQCCRSERQQQAAAVRDRAA